MGWIASLYDVLSIPWQKRLHIIWTGAVVNSESDRKISKGFIILFLLWLAIAAMVLSLIKLSYRHGYGYVESSFRLASESRLPRWVSIPPNYTRKDISMTITLYSASPGGQAQVVAYGPPPMRRQITEMVGTYRQFTPSVVYEDDRSPYYAIISVDGEEEIFEQGHDKDLLYIVDSTTVSSDIR